MCLKSGATACARPSSAMSPAGYSLAVLSSNRLRFADRLQWWGSFSLRSTEKTSQRSPGGPLLPSPKPAEMRAFYSGTDSYGQHDCYCPVEFPVERIDLLRHGSPSSV